MSLPAASVVDVSVQVCDVGSYWFLGAGAGQTVKGIFLDTFGRRTGLSFSLPINAVGGVALNLGSVSGGIPKDVAGSVSLSLTGTGATNASPIVITCASHGLATGNIVQHQGFAGNLAANGGPFYVKVLTANTYALYTDTALLVPVAGNGAYTSGGTIQPIGSPQYGALGAIVTFSGQTYFDLSTSPLADFATNYANYPSYSNADGNVPLGRVNVN